MRSTKAIAADCAAVGSIALVAGCGSGSSTSATTASANSGDSSVNAATATSAAVFGGMNGLIAAAKKEGHLNVITLPADWANHGTIMKDFTAKYGITITSENPDGPSQDELNAVNQTKGQSRAPDVLDVGTAFAVKGAQEGVLARSPTCSSRSTRTWSRSTATGPGTVVVLGATVAAQEGGPGSGPVNVLVRPEGLTVAVAAGGNGIVSNRTFLGATTRVTVLLSGEATRRPRPTWAARWQPRCRRAPRSRWTCRPPRFLSPRGQ